jgi:diadenosine tetraphosphate (Ap4A) HIT family hydrolase
LRRRSFDLDAYERRLRETPCFVCALARGERGPNHLVYEDERTLAWLNPWPVVVGYTLVAPKPHVEHVTGDFSEDEYIGLQRRVYRIGEAVRRAVPTERLYVLSLGSQQGNRHVHWHLVPLPPGVPYQEQQLEALRIERGVLDFSAGEFEELATRIRAGLEPA